MLDSDSVPLQHFFIVLEHVLRHGLKPKRGILGPKKELWDLFQMVEKWSYEAQDITASVRDLPTVKTHIGRARAWLRLALMQKKLADYFRLLIERRDDLLTEFYEPGALMLADEAIVIMGLLVGLNVIDCNLCVKEEDLDSQMGVIDFSLYLRNAGGEASPDDSPEQTDMTTVLDQKNYIEELNRHLNATVTDLQAKMETLTTTNALMKEDLAIAKNSILHLQEDNDRLRKDKGLPTQQQQEQLDREAKKASRISVIGCEEEMQDLKQQLEEESAHRKQVERELELQIQMKAESEMAAKLLEKDIHEKQDTIISLRRQLDDIKVINLEMYKKLQECEQEIFEKGMMVERLQEKTSKISSMLINLQNSEALSFHSSSTSHAQQK
ncbi:RUN and FYVE domain-containing protein 2 isoform X2 [Penaeus vannamei]|uniref:RUN and FYVE domain-containing protein 2-like isoform X2 n=1 Tax=Penaeus indicus TaxID=29960 RepID=UPI00300D4798